MRPKMSQKRYGVVMLVAWLLFGLVVQGQAAIPQTLNFQGYLTNQGGSPVNGTVAMVFSIYAASSGGTALWTESHPNVLVTAGVYNVLLGETTPVGLLFNAPYFLGIQVGADPEMMPRLPLSSVGYAFRAKEVDIVNNHTHNGGDIISGTLSGAILPSDGSVLKSLVSGANISVNNHNDGSWTINAVGVPVPIGAVIDWWRPDATWSIPAGFAICDGSTVADTDSPLKGKVLPNLTSMFIMGVTNVNNIGGVGGSSSHYHIVDIVHDHSAVSSSSAGSFTGTTGWVGDHNHDWVYGFNGDFLSWRGDGQAELMILWDNGIGNDGTGNYVIGSPSPDSGNWSTTLNGEHQHPMSIGSHSHSVDLPTSGTINKQTDSKSSLPPFYGLLKIMRIK